MKDLAYNSPMVPPEWISAHGVRPVRGPLIHRPGLPEGVCAYAGARLWTDHRPSACVWATTCDQMRRAVELHAEAVPRSFVLNVPVTWTTASSHRLYRDELRRLGRFLEKLGGHAPTADRLRKEMERWEAARRSLRAHRGRVSARDLARAVFDLYEHGPEAWRGAPAPVPMHPRGVPLLLTGAPLLPEEAAVFDLIEDAGGWVVMDGTESGELGWPGSFDRRRLVAEDPFDVLADAYFGSIPAVFRRPNTALRAWLEARVRELEPRGLLVVRRPWCDLWHAESAHIREWAPVPVLPIDLDPEAGADGTLTTRIQAFLEALR